MQMCHSMQMRDIMLVSDMQCRQACLIQRQEDWLEVDWGKGGEPGRGFHEKGSRGGGAMAQKGY